MIDDTSRYSYSINLVIELVTLKTIGLLHCIMTRTRKSKVLAHLRADSGPGAFMQCPLEQFADLHKKCVAEKSILNSELISVQIEP